MMQGLRGSPGLGNPQREEEGEEEGARSRSSSAPAKLDIGFTLRLQCLRLVRRYMAMPFPVPLNIGEDLWHWDFWTDLVHSAVLVNEQLWRKELAEYEAHGYPYYLPAPQDFEPTKSIEDRIAIAKRATNEFLGSTVVNLNDSVSDTLQFESEQFNRLIWRSRPMELWPQSLGRQNRPRQLQGRLRRALEPLIWVRVDVQSSGSWEREPLVRCYREKDQVQCEENKFSYSGMDTYGTSDWETASSGSASDGNVLSLLSLLGIRPLLSSQSLLLLPPLGFDKKSGHILQRLGLEPLFQPGLGLAAPRSWLGQFGASGVGGRRKRVGPASARDRRELQLVEDAWLQERRVTLVLGV